MQPKVVYGNAAVEGVNRWGWFMDRMALKKAETLRVKQFAIGFVIRAEVSLLKCKLSGDVYELVVHFLRGDREQPCGL